MKNKTSQVEVDELLKLLNLLSDKYHIKANWNNYHDDRKSTLRLSVCDLVIADFFGTPTKGGFTMSVHEPNGKTGTKNYNIKDYSLQQMEKIFDEQVRRRTNFYKGQANKETVTPKGLLRDIIKAWESLPGGKEYSAKEIQGWLVSDMKPVMDEARKLLK